MRSVVSRCVSPRQRTSPSRPTTAPKARGQSSSVPRRRPMRWSDKPGKMMRDLRSPRRPVVRHVMSPEVELAADALLAEPLGEAPGRLEGAGRVLPLALPADQDERDARAQPVEMLPVEVADVVHRIVEVGRIST